MHVNDVVNKKNWKGNKIMERICILAFLGINSWKDIRTREVSLLSIGVFGIVGMVRVCFLGNVSMDLVWNVCMGLFCCCFWGIVVLFLSGKGKKTEMPFVPFLMLGYIGGLIY